jgi:CubicO group peptidase (beta-lactamase class C family)
MEPDTIFRIASMSKPVTSVAALMLVEQGILSLDDPLTKWVPEFAAMRVLRRADGPLDDTYPAPRAITVEDLLTHRSGLSYPFTAAGPLAAALEKKIGSEIQSRHGPDDWIKALATLPLAYAPGERFQYGVSTDLLGFVVARASKASLRDVLLTRVFQPLGMIDTDFWIPPAKRARAAAVYAKAPSRSFRRTDTTPGFAAFVGDAPPLFVSGGAGLVSTARDYLAFARMLLNGGELNGVRLLRAETVQMMITNRLSSAQRQIPFFGIPMWRSLGFGLGVSMITNAEAYRKAGVGAGSDGAYSWPGAFGGWWQADPAEEMVVIFLPQLQPSIGELQPAPGTLRAFQKLVYEAIDG